MADRAPHSHHHHPYFPSSSEAACMLQLSHCADKVQKLLPPPLLSLCLTPDTAIFIAYVLSAMLKPEKGSDKSHARFHPLNLSQYLRAHRLFLSSLIGGIGEGFSSLHKAIHFRQICQPPLSVLQICVPSTLKAGECGAIISRECNGFVIHKMLLKLILTFSLFLLTTDNALHVALKQKTL